MIAYTRLEGLMMISEEPPSKDDGQGKTFGKFDEGAI